MLNRSLADLLPDRFPYTCQWEITCRCNLRCVMCYTDCFNHPDKIRDELTTGEILRILDELADAGCMELCLTGGEPLARPDFFDVYEHAVRSGFLVTVFTNGTLINEATADRLASLPPYMIEISLHGLREETFESVTQGRGSYQRCMTAIQLLKQRNLPLLLKSTAMTINKEEILPIKQYVGGLGSVGYKLGEEMRPQLDGSEAPERYALSDQELKEINQADPELREEACRRAKGPESPCQSGKRSFHIDAYGRLQLCSGNRQRGYDLRRGSFKTGFYYHLPSFPCQWKAHGATNLIQLQKSHA